MTLLFLSVSNVKRNLARSLAALMGMALAAALFTGVTSMATGYPVEAYQSYRDYMAADIVVYSQRHSFLPSDTRMGQGRETSWRFEVTRCIRQTDLAYFHPLALKQGYLVPTEGHLGPLPEASYEAMARVPGVRAVFPLRTIPCIIVETRDNRQVYTLALLRGRDPEADRIWNAQKFVTAGRYFGPSDQGRDVGLVSKYRPWGGSPVGAGGNLEILIPSVVETKTGPVYDFANMHSATLEVIGQFSVPTETEALPPEPGDPGPPALIQKYWETDDILVPMSSLSAMYRRAGGSGMPPAYQAGIAVTSMFHAKEIALLVAERFPQHTVMTVPEQVERSRWEQGQPSVPHDLRGVFLAIAYLAAGFVVMANMQVLVSQRRYELGVLKALGASRGDIFCLVMLEAIGTSLFGALLGFVAIRSLVSLLMLYTDAGLLKASVLTLRSLFYVLGFTTGVSALASLAPALRASGSTPMEVLRGGN